MKTKRLLSAVLWAFTGWYAWNFVADFAGLPSMVGPIVGVVVAAAVMGLSAQRWTISAPAAPSAVQPEA